jgi:hypothetical protein
MLEVLDAAILLAERLPDALLLLLNIFRILLVDDMAVLDAT